MTQNEGLMPGGFDPDEEKYDEEWQVVLNTGGKYSLSKDQALVIQEAIASGNRGIIMFRTFSISIPYVAEFYRIRRFLKGAFALPATASERAWTEEDRQKALKKLAEIKKKFFQSSK